MPVLSWGHSQYWQIAPTPGPETATQQFTYPQWQASVLCCSMFGGLQPVWEWIVTVHTRTPETR